MTELQAIVATMQRLTQEVSIQSFVANELLLPTPKDEISGMLMKQGDAHFMSIQINLLNTFLYMVKMHHLLLLLCELKLLCSNFKHLSLHVKMHPLLRLFCEFVLFFRGFP